MHGHIVRLGAFLSLGFSSWVVASMVEAVYLGILGTEALAAVGFTYPVTMVMMSLANGLGVGASSVIARRMGAGDQDAVRRLCTHTLILGLIIVTALAALGLRYAHDVFVLLGAPEHIRVLIDEYMFIWLLGIPFFTTSTLNTNLLRAAGQATVPGLIMTLGSVLQIVISPILIFGYLGAPALGIQGAAYGFVLGRVVSMAIGLYLLIFRERLMSASPSGMLESWRAVLHVGLPSIATSLVSPFASGIVTRLLAGYGPAVVAGYSVAMRADSFVMMFLMASASATGPFIGMNWAAGKFDRVKEALRLVNGFSLVWGGLCFVVMLVFGRDIVLLINQDPVVVTAAVLYLQVVPISIAFMGLQSVATSAFNALGKPLPSMLLSMSRMAVIYLPLAVLGNWLYGYLGIYLATSLTSILIGVWAWLWCRRVVERDAAIATAAAAR